MTHQNLRTLHENILIIFKLYRHTLAYIKCKIAIKLQVDERNKSE